MKRNIAIILAGGVGSRLGMSTPKQFFKVAGKMVVEHTIDVFERNQHIDEIAIVSNPALVADFENIVLRNKWRKVKKILKGGAERYYSSLSAITAYQNEDANLIFHDAVRPLVSLRIIDDVVKALDTHRAVNVAVPSADTIIEVDGDFITNIPDRSRLRRGQTPQAFDRQLISDAYDKALKDPNFRTTDDCGVVRTYLPEEPIFVVRGEESNMKLTYREDTYMMDKLFQLKSTEPNDVQIDAESFRGKVAVVFGGSYGIGKNIVEMLEQSGAHVHSFSRSATHTDVGDDNQVALALSAVEQKEGHIDYVINTAGVLNREPLASMEYDTILKAVQTNYMGTVNVALRSRPYLQRTRGKLIFFTSSSYTRGRAFYSIYSSTKAAIVNFVQAVAQEWDADGISINCINPERTKTPMRQQNFGVEPDETLLMPERVAEATLRTLLTDCTGQVIDVRRPVTN
ncbi:putative 2-C-methyl-D-erythritol 4-phosphate cytidylyltransferase [Leyella stercorea DSM 18206]|uniref:Putative 2-C-methyl-D-erythritol 4-phosphate cytidylyltransferase n=1 Tax=Leyella stercorea DSM 18206 TaxID=1002367 RepID=G6AZJ5_9BACT|nr:bifunctional cytidylyltransferase/SDR family oxidoreductase [Leyella stercorea]EHJ38365.1 putative 2-C-methyl-D-erythritol 4-phosphate cytidylyltransferase [Leyella stercorea DSM 18206]